MPGRIATNKISTDEWLCGKYKSGFFAQSILQEFNIKKQTLQSSIDALFKRELIDKEGDAYFIPDRTLELWVERL